MADNDSYEDILSGTVEEAKNEILELEDPDYERLLEAEAEGKNRKTVRQWLEKRLEEEMKEEGAEEAVDEMFLSSISPSSALVGGLVLGLVAGLVAASFVSVPGLDGVDTEVAPGDVEESVQAYADAASGMDQLEDVQVEAVTERNGMWLAEISMEGQTMEGEIDTQTVEMYVSPDGEILFPQGENIDQAIQQMEMMQEQGMQQPEIDEEELEEELGEQTEEETEEE